MPKGSEIIVCGQRFDVGQRVVTFEDDPSVNAYTPHRTDKPGEVMPFHPAKGMGGFAERYRPRRLMGGDRSLTRLQQVVRQFVLHHDGCNNSRECFNVLHNERGLSVHFLVDNDGTIIQTLDLVDSAFQAAGVNEISIGVEMANRGDAAKFPNAYRDRKALTCTVNGHQFLAYEFTKAQLASMVSLGQALTRIFPNLPQVSPTVNGEPYWGTLPDPRAYAGYLGHYHVTGQKWDPGPFDFKWFCGKIRGRLSFPIAWSGDKAEMPDEPEKLEQAAATFYDNNESEGEGGYYPVGPFGSSRLWHGGVHLRAQEGSPVRAPLAGRVVAARMTEDAVIGSRNFVLLRHDLQLGSGNVRFFTLYFHLDREPTDNPPAWFKQAGAQLGDEAAPLDVPVEAGELIGHVGEAGPPGRLDGQVHLEVFSAEEIGEKIEPGYWTLVDGSQMGRFCTAPEILAKMDTSKDGALSRSEFLDFFRQNPSRQEFRKLAVKHVSEWADDNDWQIALNRAPDFASLPEGQRKRLYREQIAPVLWWTDEIADAAGLPSDKQVWTYHPITFFVWLHDRLRNAGPAKGIGDASAWKGATAPSTIQDDNESTEGFTDDEDALSSKNLSLDDLANGYPDEK